MKYSDPPVWRRAARRRSESTPIHSPAPHLRGSNPTRWADDQFYRRAAASEPRRTAAARVFVCLVTRAASDDKKSALLYKTWRVPPAAARRWPLKCARIQWNSERGRGWSGCAARSVAHQHPPAAFFFSFLLPLFFFFLSTEQSGEPVCSAAGVMRATRLHCN